MTDIPQLLIQKKWESLPSQDIIEKTIESMKNNGFNAFHYKTIQEAKEKLFELIPEGSEVMNMTSATLDSVGINEKLKNSGKYNLIRDKLHSMDRKTQDTEMRKLGSAPEWSIGSFQALTESGEILMASATGSQLPAYAYGSANVGLVAGTHKIVKDIDEGMKRIYEHSLILESERAKKAYGVAGSSVNKVLIINKEIKPNRMNVILIDEVLGF